jgi:4-amino-4-deoxy-L-arabinose transferase-like glycosyltransferase
MPKRSRLLLIGLVWTAAFFRIHSLFTNHFHADEALFASWARLIAVWRDPMLLAQSIDKPPLLFYLQSAFYPLFGPVEWAARIPNFVTALLLIPLVAILAWHLYRDSQAAILVALFITLSPLAIQFSSTAFTDPLLVFLIAAAILFLIYRPSPAFSGLIFGLAVATKYQAWLFLPLLLGLAWLRSWEMRQVRRWFLGFAPVFLLLIIWEIGHGSIFNLWSRQINNFGGLRLAWSWELPNRLEQWGQLWRMSLGNWIFVVLFVIGCIILAARSVQERDKAARIDLLLIIFIASYIILHWLLAVPVWDRYLLPLMPYVAILLARSIFVMLEGTANIFGRFRTGIEFRIVNLIIPAVYLVPVLALLIPGALQAREGLWPLGGQLDSDQGAWQVAEILATEPYGTILYDHWYSWQWQYHLLDKKVYTSWFPYPAALVEDLQVFGNTAGRRYIVLPDSKEALPVLRAIEKTDYFLIQVFKTDYEPGMILYWVERREKGK